MPPSAGACHTIEAALNPDCGRAGPRSSIITALGRRFAAASVTIRPVSGSATRTGVGSGVGVGSVVGVGETVGVGEVVGSPEVDEDGAAVTTASPLPDGLGLDDALPATTAPPTTTASATAPMPSANGRFIVATISDPSLTPSRLGGGCVAPQDTGGVED